MDVMCVNVMCVDVVCVDVMCVNVVCVIVVCVCGCDVCGCAVCGCAVCERAVCTMLGRVTASPGPLQCQTRAHRWPLTEQLSGPRLGHRLFAQLAP